MFKKINPYAPPKTQRKDNPNETINKRLTVAQLRRVQNLMHVDPEAGLTLYAQLCEAARG